jgi:phage/plasmid-like protein (TIGR03299 family)
MSHHIDTAYYAGKPAWHGLGRVVEKARSSEEAIRLAGLNWDVVQVPLAGIDGKTQVEIPDQVLNIRSDTRTPLGIVGPRYVPLHNRDKFDFLDSLLVDGVMTYETAGSLKGGRVVWVLARMDNLAFSVGGDVQKPYMLITGAHDGTRQVRIIPTCIRVECWNMLGMALAQGSGEGYSIPHRSSMRDKLIDARKALQLVEKSSASYRLLVEKLAGKKVTADKVEFFTMKIMPESKDAYLIDHYAKWSARVEEIFYTEPTCNSDVAKGTCWGLLNAATRFVDWELPTRGANVQARDENRMTGALFGVGKKIKQSAMELMLKVK